MDAFNDSTPVSFLTVGELRKVIAEAMSEKAPRYVKGLSGLMELFKCSETKAVRIKKSGLIDDAIRQDKRGGMFLVDADKALELYDRGRRIVDERKA